MGHTYGVFGLSATGFLKEYRQILKDCIGKSPKNLEKVRKKSDFSQFFPIFLNFFQFFSTFFSNKSRTNFEKTQFFLIFLKKLNFSEKS